MIYCIDVDGTICTITTNHEYHKAIPVPEVVNKINKLYDEGHFIKIATARGQASGMEYFELTRTQLKEWGVKYHELYTKPNADFYIDDKCLNPGEFILNKDDDICQEGRLKTRGFSESAVQFLKPQEKSSEK